MPLFAITYEHPDEDGWRRHVAAHVAWLQDRLADGALLASGPFGDGPPRAALLIMSAPDRAALEALVATDPFAEEGLIAAMVVREWDPIFGAFNPSSSLPGRLQTR